MLYEELRTRYYIVDINISEDFYKSQYSINLTLHIYNRVYITYYKDVKYLLLSMRDNY